MNIIDIDISNWNLNIDINIWFLMIIIILFVILPIILKHIQKRKHIFGSLFVREYELTIAGSKMKVAIDLKDKEVVYQIWVEMATRKVGLPIDLENDVIVEVYNSWYDFFNIVRNNIKEMPINKIDSSLDLIDKLVLILNGGLRQHLTSWQAKFRKWYELEKDNRDSANLSPQDIQRKYPLYNELSTDLLKVNAELITLKNDLYNMLFKKGDKNK